MLEETYFIKPIKEQEAKSVVITTYFKDNHRREMHALIDQGKAF